MMPCTKRLTVADYSRRPSSYSKYKAIPTEVDGHRFASKKEARRYNELCLMERAGEITNLALQVKFPLDVEGMHICNYHADFTYDDKNGDVIVEDCKGVRTPAYKLKKKLMLAIYRMEILET